MCGQDGSTTNFGTSTLDRRGGAAEAQCDPAITITPTAAKAIAALKHKFRFKFIMRILLFVSPLDYSDSTGLTPLAGIANLKPFPAGSYDSPALETTSLPGKSLLKEAGMVFDMA
jgi:hypothetical protein